MNASTSKKCNSWTIKRWCHESLVYFDLNLMHNHCFFIKKILNHIWALNNFKKHFLRFFSTHFSKVLPHTPCWSAIFNFTNWNFSLQKSILKLIFAGYTGSEKQVRNSVCRTWFFQIDFSEIKYRSTEGYSSKNELILHFLKFCNKGDLIFYYVASGIFWCMQSKNALQREGIDSKTGIQGILVSSCSYWHMHAVQ